MSSRYNLSIPFTSFEDQERNLYQFLTTVDDSSVYLSWIRTFGHPHASPELFQCATGVFFVFGVLGAVSLKLLGGKSAPKLVYFVLRKELLKLMKRHADSREEKVNCVRGLQSLFKSGCGAWSELLCWLSLSVYTTSIWPWSLSISFTEITTTRVKFILCSHR